MRPTSAILSCLPLALSFLVSCNKPAADRPDFDILLLGGRLADGSGAPMVRADVGVRGGRIAAVGDLSRKSASKVIDAGGLVVAPGVIDIHTHSDYSLLVDGGARSAVTQGVTTEILGEATSAGPVNPSDLSSMRIESPLFGVKVDWSGLGEYLARLESAGTAVNVGSFAGSLTVRRFVMGETNRAATSEERNRMQAEIVRAMEEGAFGVASALLGSPLTTEELTVMARAAAEHGGIYATHVRDEGSRIFEALDEAFEIGRRSGAAVDVLHLKVAERSLWGKMDSVLARFERARSEGLHVTANMYPYIAGQNDLGSLIPPEGWEGGREKLLERLRDPGWRAKFRAILYAGGRPDWYNHYTSSEGWKSMLVVSTRNPRNSSLAGQTMDRVIAERGGEPSDVLFDLLIEEEGSVPTIFFLMSEADVAAAMRSPLVSFGSDGVAVRPEGVLGEGRPHPRWYGTFPRVLGHYVRELRVLTLESAIHKMTWMNASKLGLHDRGLVVPGFAADLMVFDPERIIDRADFSDPHRYSEGVEYVLVNGELVLDSGEHTGARPGRVLYGPGRKRPD